MVFLIPMWKTALIQSLRAQTAAFFRQFVTARVSIDRSAVSIGRQCWPRRQPASPSHGHGGSLRLRTPPWEPDLTSSKLSTSGRVYLRNDPKVVDTVNHLQLDSWKVYEQYTGPLGIGTLTDIIGVHYGPGIESAERNGWGQWLRADHDGAGMDRTVATGTGFIGQYPPELAREYESLTTCPDELLLFMHHVPYTHELH